MTGIGSPRSGWVVFSPCVRRRSRRAVGYGMPHMRSKLRQDAQLRFSGLESVEPSGTAGTKVRQYAPSLPAGARRVGIDGALSHGSSAVPPHTWAENCLPRSAGLRFFISIKTAAPGMGTAVFSRCVLLFTSFQELHPTARGQGGSSCCSATGRCPWRLRRARQPRRDTASGRWRSEPRP